jgi:hypothetical protein
MALDFPSNPTNGQVFENYYWDDSITAWRSAGSKTGVNQRVTALEGRATSLELADETTNKSGLVPVIPSSFSTVSGTSSRSGATVSFDSVSSLSLNGVFTATYNSYKIIFSQQSASATADLYFRFRASGGDKTTSYYTNGSLITGGSVAGVSNVNVNYFLVSSTHLNTAGTAHASLTMEVIQPFLAKPTTLQTKGTAWTGSNVRTFDLAGFHSETQSQDGFTLFPVSGTFGGFISVHGYNS